jgi:hypothetical protein
LITFWLGLFERFPFKQGRLQDGRCDLALPRAGSEFGKGASNLACSGGGITPADPTHMFGGDHIFKGDRELFCAK